jgi:MOSC domain-containing protein YiiM
MNTRTEKREERRKLIFAMIEAGKSRTATGKALGCSGANVSQIVRSYKPELMLRSHAGRDARNWGGRSVAKLQPDHIDFIKKEAKSHGVTPAEMARNLLVDAIFDAMDGKNVL